MSSTDGSRNFRFHRDYYDVGVNIYKKGSATLYPGITVLVGCNGSGKSTFMKIIKENLDKRKIPVIYYDNLFDGGNNSKQEALMDGNVRFLAESFMSSEGENIVLNLGNVIKKIVHFIRTGNVKKSKEDMLSEAFSNSYDSEDKEDNKNKSNELWIMLDATDSGLSIDNVVDLKFVLNSMLHDNLTSKDVYIIISCNEYEMCVDEHCFDVQRMDYVSIKSYDKFKKVILESRKYKDSLYEKVGK